MSKRSRPVIPDFSRRKPGLAPRADTTPAPGKQRMPAPPKVKPQQTLAKPGRRGQ